MSRNRIIICLNLVLFALLSTWTLSFAMAVGLIAFALRSPDASVREWVMFAGVGLCLLAGLVGMWSTDRTVRRASGEFRGNVFRAFQRTPFGTTAIAFAVIWALSNHQTFLRVLIPDGICLRMIASEAGIVCTIDQASCGSDGRDRKEIGPLAIVFYPARPIWIITVAAKYRWLVAGFALAGASQAYRMSRSSTDSGIRGFPVKVIRGMEHASRLP